MMTASSSWRPIEQVLEVVDARESAVVVLVIVGQGRLPRAGTPGGRVVVQRVPGVVKVSRVKLRLGLPARGSRGEQKDVGLLAIQGLV